MKKFLLGLSLVFVSASAHADYRDRDRRPWPWPPQHNVAVENVYCESRSYRYNECYSSLRHARIRLIAQYSQSPCIEGQSYGFNFGRVWVSNGCRGYFRLVGR